MTTIKVRDPDKRRFDRLQHEYIAESGEKITQQELFLRLLDYVEARKKDFLMKKSAIGEEEIRKFRELQEDWGVETSEDEINSVLYDIR